MNQTRQDTRANCRWTGSIPAMLWVAATAGVAFGAAPPATQPADIRLPVPAEIAKDMPPPRARAEVEAILKGADTKAKTRPIHVVLVAGPKDHGPGEHDYPAWQKAWERLLAKSPKTRVTTVWEVPSAEDLKTADVLVLFKHLAWPKELNAAIDAYFARGGGMVLVHFAVDGNQNPESVEKHIGLYWGQGPRFRHGPVDLVMAKKDTPWLRGLAGKTIHFHDETYWRLTGDPKRIDVLATGLGRGRGPRRDSVAVEPDHRQGARARQHPRPLQLDIRRPAVPHSAAARHRLGRE